MLGSPPLRLKLKLIYLPGPYQCLLIYLLPFHSQCPCNIWYFEDFFCRPPMSALTSLRTEAALTPISSFHVCKRLKEVLQLLWVFRFLVIRSPSGKTSQSVSLLWGFLKPPAPSSEVTNSRPISNYYFLGVQEWFVAVFTNYALFDTYLSGSGQYLQMLLCLTAL